MEKGNRLIFSGRHSSQQQQQQQQQKTKTHTQTNLSHSKTATKDKQRNWNLALHRDRSYEQAFTLRRIIFKSGPEEVESGELIAMLTPLAHKPDCHTGHVSITTDLKGMQNSFVILCKTDAGLVQLYHNHIVTQCNLIQQEGPLHILFFANMSSQVNSSTHVCWISKPDFLLLSSNRRERERDRQDRQTERRERVCVCV